MARFHRVAETKLGPLTKKHQAWVESVQPGLPGGDGKVLPERTFLYWLNELARIDSHR